MATANQSISNVEQRMLRPTEVASHCGFAAKHFKAVFIGLAIWADSGADTN